MPDLVIGMKALLPSTENRRQSCHSKHYSWQAAQPCWFLPLLHMHCPATTHVERSAVIDAAPEEIFKMLSSNRGFQQFNPFKDTDPDLEIRLTGPERGVGSGFSFKGRDGSGTQTITALQENRSVTMKIDLGAMGQPTQHFQLTPVQDGTRVVWGMDAEFGLNPIGRLFGLFIGPSAWTGL